MRAFAPTALSAPVEPPSEALTRLITEAASLPSSRPVISSVLNCTNDPDASIRDLADLCVNDGTLATSLLRTANSAFYGLSGRVSTVQFAVTVLGFSSVRSIVTMSLMDDPDVPSSWWEASAVQAVAAGHLAGPMHAGASDAFCAGLISDLGRTVLRHVDAAAYTATCDMVEHPDDRPAAEVAWASLDHADVAAALFSHWRFPEKIIEAVRLHHHPVEHLGGDPLRLTVRAAHEIASRISGSTPRANLADITRGTLTESDVPGIAQKVEADAEGVLAALGR